MPSGLYCGEWPLPTCPGVALIPSLLFIPALIVPGEVPADQALRVAQPLPLPLDLRQTDPGLLVPSDGRDPAQAEAAREAWKACTGPVQNAQSVRLLLPRGPVRLPMLLAACQALKARNPACRIYVGFDPVAEPILDDLAWGAVEGGALLPADLGQAPDRWLELLQKAQVQFPGRPWTLWVDVDPGPRLAQILGDGGRLAVPAQGPAAELARAVPEGFLEVEGGLGDLTLRNAGTGQVLRWRFDDGRWNRADPFRKMHEVQVVDHSSYNVGALLARMRAVQLRDRARLRNSMALVEYAMHFQGERGSTDLSLIYRIFEKAGEPEEGLREAVRFNGVAAKLHGDVQLPIVEARATLATPVALTLTERYRYADGGAAGPGVRRILFQPVDPDPLLPQGELRVEEATGRILEERARRSGLPGVVRSEDRVMTYGEPKPGFWRVLASTSMERWMTGAEITQVRRTVTFSQFSLNDPDFEAARNRARAGDGNMIKQTLEGARYFTRQPDGSRKVQEHAPSGGKGIGGVLLMAPGADLPITPLAGLFLFDFNAFGRGIQYTLLTAGVFNDLNLTIPDIGAGIDAHSHATLSALGASERPVVHGQLQDRDGVQRRTQSLDLDISRDLGFGFRLSLAEALAYVQFSLPSQTAYRTPGFRNPPSGWNTFTQGQLIWQHAGFLARAYYGQGQRPEGVWGSPTTLQAIPDSGRYRRWGGALTYDVALGQGKWLQATLGGVSGSSFDRFQAQSFDGLVSGIKPHAVVADRITYGALRAVLATGPAGRLTVGLDHGLARTLDDQKTYGFTGLSIAGDVPGFWWFTTVRVQLGIGLQSDIPGLTAVTGMVSLVRII
jgi:hypothetical protein